MSSGSGCGVEPFETIWLNINGINSNKSDSNFYLLIRLFLKSSYSIMFLQEPRLKEGKVGHFEDACNWPQSKVVGHFTSNAAGNGGVATIAKKDFVATTTNFLVNEIGADECQHVTFSIGTTQFSFANVHMDSHDGSRRGTLCNTLQEVLPTGTIIGGDFNMVQDLDLDTQRPHSTSPYGNEGWQQLIDMQSALQVNDLWREENGDKRLFTHGSRVPGGTTRTRIDYVLCPCHAMVGHCELHTSHDHSFWQGTGRADHIGVTLKVKPVEHMRAGPKKRAAPPYVFETHQWHASHSDAWELHILEANTFTSIWEWWEAWKPKAVELARTILLMRCHSTSLGERDMLITCPN